MSLDATSHNIHKFTCDSDPSNVRTQHKVHDSALDRHRHTPDKLTTMSKVHHVSLQITKGSLQTKQDRFLRMNDNHLGTTQYIQLI